MRCNKIYWVEAHTKPWISHFNKPEYSEDHISLLHQYMTLVSCVMPSLMWTSLFHSDLHLDNIFIDLNTEQITGIIDWQSASVCEPYFQYDTLCMLTLTGQNFADTSFDKPLASEVVFNIQFSSIPASDTHNSLSLNDKSLNTESELLQHYQDFTQLKTLQRWEALNILFCQVIVASTEAVTEAWEQHNVYLLYNTLITVVFYWPDIVRKSKQPCSIQFSEKELENYDAAAETVQGLLIVLHQIHNNNLVPLNDTIYAERFELTAALNKEFHQTFIDIVETDEQRKVTKRVWPYQDCRQ